MVPRWPSLVYSKVVLLPMTRSRGTRYMSWLIGRMKSHPPPEAMQVHARRCSAAVRRWQRLRLANGDYTRICFLSVSALCLRT